MGVIWSNTVPLVDRGHPCILQEVFFSGFSTRHIYVSLKLLDCSDCMILVKTLLVIFLPSFHRLENLPIFSSFHMYQK